MVDFVEICKVCTRKALIEAAKRIINSDKVCHSYSDLNFGVTFLEHSVRVVHIKVFHRMQYIRLLVIFHSCKFQSPIAVLVEQSLRMLMSVMS